MRRTQGNIPNIPTENLNLKKSHSSCHETQFMNERSQRMRVWRC